MGLFFINNCIFLDRFLIREATRMTEELPPAPEYRPYEARGLISAIQDKIGITKQIKKYNKEIEALLALRRMREADISRMKKYNEDRIAEIKDLNDPSKSLTINLIAKEIKLNWWQKFTNRVFRFDGYIAYINVAKELKIFKVDNFQGFYNVANNAAAVINKSIATYNGRPIMLIKWPFPITLDVQPADGVNPALLVYDMHYFYNYVNKVTKTNLTNWGSNLDLGGFIKKYWLIIIIFIGLGLLFFTPQGKEILAQLIPSSRPA